MIRGIARCPHQSGRRPFSQSVPDHRPLSRGQIIRLLRRAAASRSSVMLHAIQIRLVQAIPGMTCPRPLYGPVAARAVRLQRLFLDGYQRGADPQLVDRIIQLLNS